MSRRVRLLVVSMLVMSACSSGLGLGLPECEDVPRRPTTAMILSLQAVPSADYAPCLDEVPLGWTDVQFTVEDGLARFTVTDSVFPFLTVSLTPMCDPGSAPPVPTAVPGVDKYEVMTRVEHGAVDVVIVPTGESPVVRANAIVRQYDGTEVEDRLVDFQVDGDLDVDLRSRVNRAFMNADFVWIIDELDALEETVQIRTAPDHEVARGVSVEDAFDRMERFVEEPHYEGTWYFTFVGGCVTYEFRASGRIADNVVEDVETAFGLYDLDALRELGRRNGIDLEQAPPPEG